MKTKSRTKSIARRTIAAALLSGGLAVAGFGLASGTAQAAPSPAPGHFWNYCEYDDHWYFWDWDWDWDHYCHYDYDYDHHDHHDHHDDDHH